jgi:N-acetylneuraminate synthase/N,N'-diacetyllegionaminate synthase
MRPKVKIIAEAGVNHNGDFFLAKKLIDAAADSGADFVKFQTFKAEKIVSPKAKPAQYQAKNILSGNNNQSSILKKLEMPDQWHFDLLHYANKKEIS